MKKNSGFTLIEIIVVVGVISLILPVIFSIVYVLLREQTKIIRLQEVKRQGDFALNAIKTTIKNSAISLYPNDSDPNNKVCFDKDSSYSSPYFLDKNGNYFNFFLDNNKISSGPANIELNDDNTLVTNFSLDCSRNNLYSPPLISVSFDIAYNTNSTKSEEKVTTLHYQTKFKLKTY